MTRVVTVLLAVAALVGVSRLVKFRLGAEVVAAPSGRNWKTTQKYMELREKDLKAGTVSDALLALLDDNVQYHVKGLMSTTDYKGKAEVKEYLAEPAQMKSHSYEEDGYKPEQDGTKITVFSDAKKFGMWLKVRAVFTFAANGKIVDVWAGKASAVHIIEFLGYGKHVEAAPSGRNWETAQKYMTLREKDLKAGTVSDALLALLDDNVQYHVKSLMSTTDYKGKAEVKEYLAEPAQMISHSYSEDGYKPEQHGDKITVFSDAKKFGLWLKVRAVFTFAASGKIVDVWVGKA